MVRADPVPNTDGTPPIPQTPPIAPGQYVHRAIIPLWVPPLLLLLIVALWFLLKDRNKVQLALTPDARVQVAVGASAAVKATVTNMKGEAIDSLTKKVRWVVDDSTIAAINDSGALRGVRIGTTALTATVRKVKKTLQVEVVQAQVASLLLAPAQLNLVVGGRGALRAVAKDALGNVLQRDIMWSTSNPSVAVVAGNGAVIASDTGLATITAMSEGRVANSVVTVKPNAAMKAAGGGADCTVYDPGALKVVHDKNIGWIVTGGSSPLLTLDNELDAKRAMQLARGYRSHCYLGRANKRPNRNLYIIEYWTNRTGAVMAVENNDCGTFAPTQLRIADNGPQGFALMDGKRALLQADTRDDAQKIWEVAQQYTAQCFIGRGNRRPNQRDYIVQYWR
jgi:hypothetical protein